jgi:hypothetical protein
MADNNQQVEEPALLPQALNAQKEFNVILDVLLVPLRADTPNQKLPFRRRWRGGCLLKRPDLVPVNPNPGAGPEGYCNTDNQGRLLITVKNQGTAEAPPSITKVSFSSDVFHEVDTPAIRPEQEVSLPTPKIPDDCFGSTGCEFQIIVDARNQVVEFDKANNTVSGKCSGGNDVE